MKELTEEFIRQFDIYLRTEVGLQSATAEEYAKPIKMIVTRAHRDGILSRNPFSRYHISRWWIVTARQKTKVPFRVKLLDSAYRIIECYEPYRKGNRLFDLPCNPQTNRKLRQVVKECGIDKPVTFHQGRHSDLSFRLKTSKLQA